MPGPDAVVAFSLAKSVVEFRKVWCHASEALRGDAGFGAKEVESVGDGADRATAFAGDLGSQAYLNV